MSEEFEFDDNDDIFSNVEFPEEESISKSSLQNITTHKSRNISIDLESPLKSPLKENAALHITTESQLSPVLSTNKKNNIQEQTCKRETSKKLLRKSSSYLDDCSPVKRLFPGPAGILLDSGQYESNDSLLCTQGTFSVFQDGGPWAKMCADFSLGNSTLSEKFNIEWIKKEASTQNNLFLNHKAPFLAGVIQSLEEVGVQQKTINVTLRDVTGTIQGMIEDNIYTEYASHFTLGSVIVVTNFTVLCCTCNKCDNFHLTITKNNLCSIYGRKKLELQKLDLEKVVTEYYKKLNDLKNKNRDISKIENISGLRKNVCKQAVKHNQNIKKSNNKIAFTHPTQIQTDKNVINGSKVKYKQTNAAKILDRPLGGGSSPELSNITRYTFKSVINTKIVPLGPLINHTKTQENKQKSEINNVTSHENHSENVVKLGNTEISVTVNKLEEKKIWEETLEGLDMNQFLEDF